MNLTNCLPKSVVSRSIIPRGAEVGGQPAHQRRGLNHPARSAVSIPAVLSSLAMSR